MLEDDPDVSSSETQPVAAGTLGEVAPEELDGPVRRNEEARDRVEDGRLSAPARPSNSDDFPGRDRQRDVGERPDRLAPGRSQPAASRVLVCHPVQLYGRWIARLVRLRRRLCMCPVDRTHLRS